MTVYVWGDNEYGQIGLGVTGRAVTRPVVPTAFGPVQTVDQVFAGAGHTMIRSAGICYGIGANIYGGLCNGTKDTPVLQATRALLSDVEAFVLAESHGLAITTSGAFTWGGNLYGAAGIGTSSEGSELNGEHKIAPPVCYDTPQAPLDLPSLAAVGAGQYHDLAIDPAGRIWAWGFNDRGQLGIGTGKAALTPVKLASTSAKPVEVDGGAKHSAARLADGMVLLWGNNRWGQLGQPLANPVINRPHPLTGFKCAQASCGGNFTLLLDEAGHVWKAGVFLPEDEPVQGLEPVTFPEPVTAVSAGTNHALALGASGEVYGWGHNRYGQVGDGTQSLPAHPNMDKAEPVALGIKARAVSAGWLHSAALQ